MGSGLHVLAVIHGAGQVLRNVLDGGQGIHVAHQVRTTGDVAFRAVEQGIKALICRECRRHARHQFRIHDREYGEQGSVAHECLFKGILFGDDARIVRFRPGACRGGDGYDRQRPYSNRIAFTGADGHIVPQFAFVGCHYRYGFRAVHNTSATQRHEEVASFFTCGLCSGVNIADSGVGHHAVEQESFHACLVQLFLRARQITVGAGRFPVGDNDEGAPARHRLLIQFVQHSCPEHHTGRDVHVVIRIRIHMRVI